MIITPKVVELHAPFAGNQQTQSIAVKNNSNDFIAFKVKTTAPKLYCVRPNSGVIQPNSSANVNIVFQGLKEEPPIGSKFKDKFLFISTPCSPDFESSNVSTGWNNLVDESNGNTTEMKIKVAFLYDQQMNTIHEEDKSLIDSHSNLNNNNTNNNNNINSSVIANSIDPNITSNSTVKRNINSSSNITNSNQNSIPAVKASNNTNSNKLNDSIPSNNINTNEKISGSNNSSNINNNNNNNANISKQATEKRENVHIEPPTATKSKNSKNETNIYLIAVLFIILAFLISRFF